MFQVMIGLSLLTTVFSHLAAYSMDQPLLSEWGGEISPGKRKSLGSGWCLEVFLACHEFPVSYVVCSGARQCYQKERGKSFGQGYSQRWHLVFPRCLKLERSSQVECSGEFSVCFKKYSEKTDKNHDSFLSSAAEFSAPQSHVCLHHCLLV